MLFRPSCEEANVVPLIIPFIDLPDRFRIRLRGTHQFRMLIVHVLTDTAIDVQKKYFGQ